MNTEGLSNYLLNCCKQYDFDAIVIADHDGMMLAHEGEALGDAFIAHLPVWLESGDRVSKLGGMGGSLCCCVLPADRSSLMLAWAYERNNNEQLFLAIRTRSLPPRLGATLEDIATSICQYIDKATSLSKQT